VKKELIMNSKLKNYLMISLLALTMAGLSVYGADAALAQGQGWSHDSFIQKLSERFGIEESDIEAVLEEVRQEHQAENQAWFAARLSAAVINGEITEEQKQLIIQKHEEIRARWQEERLHVEDLTPEERRQASQEKRQELAAWAKENGVEVTYFGQGQDHSSSMAKHGMGKPRGFALDN
jgi:hypothetical protein